MQFCDYLRQARKKAGLTQKDVAKLAGMSESQYRAYEGGGRPNPSFAVVVRLARAVGFDLNDCAATCVAV